jgi:hypothetical protein
MLLIAPGAAFAHLNQPDQGDATLVHACVAKSGVVKIINGTTSDCKKNDTRTHWPLIAPPGAPGTPGTPGAPGAPGVNGVNGEPGVGILGGSSGSVFLAGTLDQFMGVFNAGRSRDQADVELPIPADGTVSNLYVLLSGPPGTGKSWQFVVRNGTTDTAVTCTIQGLATSCSDLTNAGVFAAGNPLSIRVIGAGSPASRLAQWSGVFLAD